jgi:multidrug efflux pump subunit AcrA (membrane-fusion protein)
MFAVARIDRGDVARRLFAPRAAVVEDPNTNSFRVFVIDDENRARLRVIELDARQEGDMTRVVAGVDEGERVAVSNLAELFDTAPVVVAGASPPAPSE